MFRALNYAPRKQFRIRALGYLATCFLATHLLGCQDPLQPTEVVVAIDSDMRIGTELNALTFAVYDLDDSETPLRAQTIDLAEDPGPGVQTLPLTLSIAAEAPESRSQFRIVVTGLGPEVPGKADSAQVALVEQQALTGFVPGRRPLLQIYLSRRCLGVLCREATTDESPQACSLATATCELIQAIDASTLPETEGDGLEQLTVPSQPDTPDRPDATLPPAKEPDGGAPMLTCDPGYALVDGLCEDVDECLAAPFPCPEGTCENLPGSYRCELCDAGYRADGAGTCVDVDECASTNGGCDARTVCTNTPGGRTCGPCPDGYTGDGESGCVGTGPCATDNGGCDAVTTCTANASSVVCGACPAGYSGSGDVGCAPELLDLRVDHGTLQPAFDPAVTDYVVTVPLLVDAARVEPFVPAGAEAAVNQELVSSSESAISVALGLGETIVPVVVSRLGAASKTYQVTFIRGELEAYLKASNADAGDRFAKAVLDGDTLVVTAEAESSATAGTGVSADQQLDNSLGTSGAAYVFVRSGGTWTQQAFLKASNPDENDIFGHALALDGDTLVVTATGERSAARGTLGTASDQADNGTRNAGAAYVFVRNGSTWTQQAYLKASNTGPGDYFGDAVAISGDTIAVSATFEDSNARGTDASTAAQADDSLQNSGAVYVFVRGGSQWAQEAYLKASNSGTGDNFGASVGLSGDTLVVGAPLESSAARGTTASATEQEDDSLQGSGAAYVFVRGGSGWSQEAYLKASNPGADDHFGLPVALFGDTLAVSALSEASGSSGVNPASVTQSDDSLEAAGAVYLFERSAGQWSLASFIKSPNPDAKDQFGGCLSLSGSWLAVGSVYEDGPQSGVSAAPPATPDNNNSQSGAAYLYHRTEDSWALESFVKASNPDRNDFFGCPVSLSASRLAVGASLEDSGATGTAATVAEQADNSASASGAVYVY